MLKDKVIIVAEHHYETAHSILNMLRADGFSDIRLAESGDKIYEILRPFYDQPEQIGLIIIDEALPQAQIMAMCQSLSTPSNGTVVPFVILSSSSSTVLKEGVFQYDLDGNSRLTYLSYLPVDAKELLLAVNFLLSIKHERFLRFKQEERLISELANKNVIDAKLKFLAAHDELTGLLNRSNFERQLRLVLNRNNKLQRQGALLFVDIDRFSLINELEGFEVGDKLLVELVVLIRKMIPHGSLFSRISSDEFCLFIENKSEPQIQALAETIKNTVENFRFFSGDVCYSTSISVGIATLGGEMIVTHPGQLMLRGRQACNLAKANGRNRIRFYRSDDQSIKERQRDIYWIPIIRRALQENNFFLVFQPVVHLHTGDVSHYEVLLRMRSDSNEIIGPDKFIPAAERMGLIHNIDLWVVENAIDFLAALPSHRSYVSLAINLSGTAFQDPELLPTIRDKLELTWVDASRLTFEITETAAVDNFEKTREMINKIRSLGCKFALDDFGAGFCSFNYLKAFPVDYVKIDGQFIRNLLHDETDQMLVKSMVEIVSKLGKKTIAEFVENTKTAAMLIDMGVQLGQGYAFGKPEINLLDKQTIAIVQPPTPQDFLSSFHLVK